jgi:very-short-patch-repair endonuclease
MNDLEIIRLYTEENKSPQEIADHFNTYPNKIRRMLVKNGYTLKSRSEAQKIALASGRREHPTAGKQRTESEKIKISNGVSKNWKEVDPSEKKRRATISKERWAAMSTTAKENMHKSAISAIREAGKAGSKLEKFFAGELGKFYSVEYHKKNLIANADLEIDMYLPKLQTIIEIDGPSHFLPIWGEDKLKKQIKADLDKNGLILSKGFNIIRLKVTTRVPIGRRQELVDEVLKTLRSIENGIINNSYTEIEA